MNNLRNLPRQSRSHNLVDRIVDATARILTDGRQSGLTTNGAAAEAGISVGSLYRYFPNKDALIIAVIEREGHRCYEQIREATQDGSADSLAEHVGRIVTATMCAYRSTSLESRCRPLELRQRSVFDCRAGALSAIAHTLTSECRTRSGSDLRVVQDVAVVMTEIIVGLVEAAMTRPTPALSSSNVEQIATAAAISYLECAKT